MPSRKNQVPLFFWGKNSTPAAETEAEKGSGENAENGAKDANVVIPSARSGRLALSYENVEQTYNKIPKEQVEHELLELDDKLGKLTIAIVKDPVGYEVCLVTNTVFDAAARSATNWEGPDFEVQRENLRCIRKVSDFEGIGRGLILRCIRKV